MACCNVSLRPSVFILAALLLGCTSRPTAGDDDGAVGSTSGSTPPLLTTGEPPAPSDTTGGVTTSVDTSGADTTQVDSSDDGLSTVGFLCNSGSEDPWHCGSDGGGVVFECDLFAQDCPREEKCSPWANDGGPFWNATRCAPFDPGADAVGEACIVEGSAVSGIDSCELGSMCWDVDWMDNTGVCAELCEGDEAQPTCSDGTICRVSNSAAIIVCVPPCDPLASECEEGHVCTPDARGDWSCVPGVTTPLEVGEPCEFDNICEAGSVCAGGETTPGCIGAAGCCTALCDLTNPICDAPAAQCVPWYEPGVAPPDHDTVGICTVDPQIPEGGWGLEPLLLADLP